jgi:hypothetical protein
MQQTTAGASGVIKSGRRLTGQSARGAMTRRDLPYSHIHNMVYHMKTTLNIDDTVMAELKREAARQGRTMSDLVETALRLLLHPTRKRKALPELPTFDGGEPFVDIADRDALYDAMERR